MKSTVYEKNLRISSCLIDSTSHMSLPASMELVQDMVSEQTGLLGIDDFNLKQKSNAIWVMNKIRLKINRMPEWNDAVKLTSRIIKPTGVQCRWDFLAANEQETPFWIGRAELCMLDYDTHRIRRVNSTCHPLDLEFCEPNGLKFEKFRPAANSENYVYTRIIRATDIDIVRHTNNVKYNTIALDAFTAAELDAMDISEYEIDFVSESHESDPIDVYRYPAENGCIVAGFHHDSGKMVFKIRILLRNIDTIPD